MEGRGGTMKGREAKGNIEKGREGGKKELGGG